MPTAPQLDAPQGQPVFEVQFRTISESLAGNGVLSSADLEVTATANALEIEVASGTAYYNGSEVSLNNAPQTFTLSSGPSSGDRWDTVYFDTATGDAGVREGVDGDPSNGTYPQPPDIQADELLLAIVYVEQTATNVSDADILNWRAEFSNEAELVDYDDGTGVYGAGTVDAALDELQEAAQIGSYPLANSDLANSTVDVTAGTALTTTSQSISLGGSATLDVAGVTDSEIASSATIARSKLSQDKITTTISSATTTSDEEVVFVDTSAGGFALTLASADVVDGNEIVVVDVAGAVETDALTIDTESAETIDGQSSITLDTNYGAQVLQSDGSNWYTAGGGSGGGASLVVEDSGSTAEDPTDTLDFGEALSASGGGNGTATADVDHAARFVGGSGTSGLADGDQLLVERTDLADGEELAIYAASLTDGTDGAAPTDLDLVIATVSSGTATVQTTLISGDGATVHGRVTGTPLGAYTNTSGGGQVVAVLADNATGGKTDPAASAQGVIR